MPRKGEGQSGDPGAKSLSTQRNQGRVAKAKRKSGYEGKKKTDRATISDRAANTNQARYCHKGGAICPPRTSKVEATLFHAREGYPY